MLKTILLAGIISTGLMTQAQSKKMDRSPANSIKSELEKCMNDNASTLGMRECISEQNEIAQAQLNKTISDLQKSLSDDKETLKRLKASQKAWEKFKIAQCELESAEMLGGTGEALIFESCALNMTIERIDSLKK